MSNQTNKDKLKHFPLELTDDLHICLWDEKAEYKWTIAYWLKGKEDMICILLATDHCLKEWNGKHLRS